MKITIRFLKEKNACIEGIRWFNDQKENEPIKVIKSLMKENCLDWANWLIVRCMTYQQYVRYAIYAAKQVLHIFEEKYPDDKRPRQAINAALNYLKNPSKENKVAAVAAVAAAYAAAAAAAYAAVAAAAADAAAAAKTQMQIKILKYGIKLLNL